MLRKFTYKGRYTPENPKKYIGDPSKIVYRSSWERRFMIYCDRNPLILSWASEELAIPICHQSITRCIGIIQIS